MSLPAKISGRPPSILPDIAVFDERCLREVVGLDHETMAAAAKGLTALSEGRVTAPPALRLDVKDHNGGMDTQAVYISGVPYFAVRISSNFPENIKGDLPCLGGLLILFHAETGRPAAILYDNDYLTQIRAALSGALAARYLARDNVRTVGIMGTGYQARLQLEALRLVRDFDDVLVWGRNFNKAEQYADEMTARQDIPVQAIEEAETLVRDSDVVVTTTSATEPVIKADWLHPGIHVTAIGSAVPVKNELDPNIIVRADRYVCDRKNLCEIQGELHHAVASGAVTAGHFPVTELGELVRGIKPGRENDEQVTVCDLTGTGAQDTMVASYAYERLRV